MPQRPRSDKHRNVLARSLAGLMAAGTQSSGQSHPAATGPGILDFTEEPLPKKSFT